MTVRYSKPGTLPPIYLAGSFSEPAWQPQEMEYTAHGDNEYEYHKDVQLEEGVEYQYKFRIGEGDWWILNEDAPTGTCSEQSNSIHLLEESIAVDATHDVTPFHNIYKAAND